MKIEELMIGDIILRKSVGNDWNPIRVDKSLLYDIQDHPEWYKPIKFTDEFLINNFERQNTGFIIDHNIILFKDTLMIETSKDNYLAICQCKFLHELQHFFSLRKVVKEFKL